jgi:hypothetical protein
MLKGWVRWLRVLVVGLPLLAQAQEEAEGGHRAKEQVEVSACAFDGPGPKSRGQLTEREWEECGASMCTTFGTVHLGLEGARPLVEVNLTSGLQPGGGADLPPLEVQCAPGKVTLRPPEYEGPPVVLEYREGRFTFAKGFLEELGRGWKSPTGAPWKKPEDLVALDGVLTDLEEVDRAPSQAVRLLLARSHLRAERWDPAEFLLLTLAEEKLPAELKARREALAGELRRVREETVPLRVAAWTRLGKVMKDPVLPPWAEGEVPTVFWQGTRLCVAQEDASPPTHMRCHEPKTGKWSERLPLALPPGAPAGLQSNYQGRVCLYADNCWHRELPALEESCGGFTCTEVLALAPGPVILVAGEKGPHAYTKEGERELGAGEASAVVGKSLGTRLAGGARYAWGEEGRLRPVTNPQKSWEVLGASPPPDTKSEGATQWRSVPLASPDQQWVLRVAMDAKQQRVLWLGKLEPVAAAKAP